MSQSKKDKQLVSNEPHELDAVRKSMKKKGITTGRKEIKAVKKEKNIRSRKKVEKAIREKHPEQDNDNGFETHVKLDVNGNVITNEKTDSMDAIADFTNPFEKEQ